ncbi:MAG: LCP family protein, partial [Patescibacteria group bacterium]|nr:LCP family protein [Patescibacteria group bacterium]
MKNFDSLVPKTGPAPQIDSRVGLPEPPTQVRRQEVSLLKPTVTGFSKPRKKHRLLKFIVGLIVLAVLVLGGLAATKAMNLSDKIFVGQKYSFFQKIQFAIRGAFGGETLIGENLGQVNILLLGIGGEGHDGPYLTDTMIVAQIRPDLGQATLTSLPRDYLVELPGNLGYRKINAAFAEGYNLHKDYSEAGRWATETTEKVTGLKLPYFAVIDFKGFEKVVDLLGGVDVNVDRTFTDYQFPDSGIGYLPPVTFQQGPLHLTGEKALQFARSRHGNNGEGSDFARSLRQEKVINAFKNKAFELNLVTDSGKINSLLNTFADHFHTNINPAEIFRLYNLTKEKNIKKFLSSSLDETTGLVCPKILEESGAWVLVPCPGKTTDDVQNFFKNSFVIGKL